MKGLILLVNSLILFSCCLTPNNDEFPIPENIDSLIPYDQGETLNLLDTLGNKIKLFSFIERKPIEVELGGERSCDTETYYNYKVTLSNPSHPSMEINWSTESRRRTIGFSINGSSIAYRYVLHNGEPYLDDYYVKFYDSLPINGLTYKNVYELNDFSSYPSSSQLKRILYNLKDKILQIEFYSGDIYQVDN